jgi:PAS domain-containing protein
VARLTEAQQVARIGSFEREISTNKIYWSNESYRLFGLDPNENEMTYEGFLSRVHPEDMESMRKAGRKILKDKILYGLDIRMILPDGEERIVHTEARLFLDDEDKPLQLLGSMQDVTEQRRVEEAIRLSETRIAESQSLAHIGSWETDLQTDKVYWSDETYRLFGMQPQEIAMTYEILFPGSSRRQRYDSGRVHNFPGE